MTHRLIFALLLLLSVPTLALAQRTTNPSMSVGTPGVREYARPGYPTMTLRVWSNAGTSGLWRVERDVDFIELLTVLGAGSVETNQEVRVRVRVFRGDETNRQQIYEARLIEILNAEAQPPALQDEDILYIETRQRRITFRGVMSVVGSFSSLAVLFLRLSRFL